MKVFAALLLCMMLTFSGITRPVLPFPDNPDANQCGLPVQVNTPGILSGVFHGRMYEPQVRMYDSHARQKVVALIPSGTPALALLQVSGPRLNYLLIRVQEHGNTVEGWVPAPYFHSK